MPTREGHRIDQANSRHRRSQRRNRSRERVRIGGRRRGANEIGLPSATLSQEAMSEGDSERRVTLGLRGRGRISLHLNGGGGDRRGEHRMFASCCGEAFTSVCFFRSTKIIFIPVSKIALCVHNKPLKLCIPYLPLSILI